MHESPLQPLTPGFFLKEDRELHPNDPAAAVPEPRSLPALALMPTEARWPQMISSGPVTPHHHPSCAARGLGLPG